MKHRRTGAVVYAIATAVAALAAAAPAAIAGSAPSIVKLQHSGSPAAQRTPTVGSVAGNTSIPFEVSLTWPTRRGLSPWPRRCRLRVTRPTVNI